MIIIETSVTNMLTEFLIISYNEPTNAQLIDKWLFCPYNFQHYCVILRELVGMSC